MKYRKKPVVIEAVKWTNLGNCLDDILKLANPSNVDKIIFAADGTAALEIKTLEGIMRADVNDWIIKGVKGELYPCKPDIFKATYEPCEPDELLGNNASPIRNISEDDWRKDDR